jgi:hypothetical protein
MKLLFRAAHSIEAQSLKDLLRSAGIDSTTRNENTALFGEGIFHPEGMPEIWVDDSLFERALAVKQDWVNQGTGVVS